VDVSIDERVDIHVASFIAPFVLEADDTLDDSLPPMCGADGVCMVDCLYDADCDVTEVAPPLGGCTSAPGPAASVWAFLLLVLVCRRWRKPARR
jgi:hypothetical protein